MPIPFCTGWASACLASPALAAAPLDEVMRTMVIEPLGMKDSSMVWRDGYETQCAVGHDILTGINAVETRPASIASVRSRPSCAR